MSWVSKFLRKNNKVLSVVLPVVSAGASFIPGVGPLAAVGIRAAASGVTAGMNASVAHHQYGADTSSATDGIGVAAMSMLSGLTMMNAQAAASAPSGLTAGVAQINQPITQRSSIT